MGFLWKVHNSQLHQHDLVELSQGPQSSPQGSDFQKSDGEPVWVDLCPWTQVLYYFGIEFPYYLLRWPQCEAQMWEVWTLWGLCREWGQTDKIWRTKYIFLIVKLYLPWITCQWPWQQISSHWWPHPLRPCLSSFL